MKKADLIMLSDNTINVASMNNVFGAIVMGMVNGSIKKWEGKLVYDRLDEVHEEAVSSDRYSYEQTGWNRDLFQTPGS